MAPGTIKVVKKLFIFFSSFFFSTFNSCKGVLCILPKRKGEEAPSLSTVRGASQNGDGPDQADVAPGGSAASQKKVKQQKVQVTKKKVKQKVQSRAHLNRRPFAQKPAVHPPRLLKVTNFHTVPIFVLLTWNWFVRTNFRTFEGLKTKWHWNSIASRQK